VLVAGTDGQPPTRSDLGDLLRARRGRLQPVDVGLPQGQRRRTAGLRREEVALLASISTTYYTFLEQGRDVRPSRQVLDALASALRLGAADRAHLYQLAHGMAPEARPGPEMLAPGVAALVDRLEPHPTYVTGRRWDVLAANAAARALFLGWPRVPADKVNLVWWMFTAPQARQVYVDWEAEAGALLARFRAAADRHPDDPDFAELIDRLHRDSPSARAWWSRHEILPLSGSGTKRLRQLDEGEHEYSYVVLQITTQPDQKVVTFARTDDG